MTDPKTDPKDVKTDAPQPHYIGFDDLADAYKNVQRDYVRQIDSAIELDPSEYDFELKIGVNPEYDKIRARAQGGGEQAWNAFARTGMSLIPEIIGGAAAIVDIPGYFSDQEATTNWVTESMNELKEEISGITPIYRENPDKHLDWQDPAWWAEFGSTVGTSALAFAATGWATGMAVGKLGVALNSLGRTVKGTKKAEQGIKMLEEAANVMTKTGELTTKAKLASATLKTGNFIESYAPIAQTGANAFLMNHSEGVLEAGGAYDQVYNATLDKGFGPDVAHKEAGLAAARSMEINRWNVFLNLTSASAFTRATARGLATKTFLNPNALKMPQRIVLESGQEYIEETVNAYAQKKVSAESDRALLALSTSESNVDFKMMGKLIASREGVEAGFWGAVGGAVQTIATTAGTNRKASQAAREAYRRHLEYQKDLDIAAKEKGGQNFWTFGVGAESLNKLNLEKEALAGALSQATPEQVPDLLANIQNIDDQILLNQFYSAASQGEYAKLVRSYKEVAKMSAEEADKANYEVDPNSREYYVSKAENALDELAILEDIYNRTGSLEANNHVSLKGDKQSMFVNRVQKHQKKKQKIELLGREQRIEEQIQDLEATALRASEKTEDSLEKARIAKKLKSLTKLVVDNADAKNIDKYINKLDEEILDLDEAYFEGTSQANQKKIREFNKKIEKEVKEARKNKKAEASKKSAVSSESSNKLKENETEAEAAKRKAETVKKAEEQRAKEAEEEKNEDDKLDAEGKALEESGAHLTNKRDKDIHKLKVQAYREKRKGVNRGRKAKKVKSFLRETTRKFRGKKKTTKRQNPSLALSIVNKEAGENIIYGKTVEEQISSITQLLNNKRKGLHSLYDTIAFQSREFLVGEDGEIVEITNHINEVGKELLDAGKFKEGTKISIAVDKNYTGDIRWNNGEITNWQALKESGKLSPEELIDYTPIAISHNGKVVGHISTIESLATRKLNPTHTNEVAEIQNLRELRKSLMELKEPFNTEINSRTAGALFLDAENKAEPVNEHLVEGTLYGIYRNDQVTGANIGKGVITNEQQIIESSKNDNINGFAVALIPSYKENGLQHYTMTKLHRSKMSTEMVNSGMQAINIYNKAMSDIALTPEETKAVKDIVDIQRGRKNQQGRDNLTDLELEITNIDGITHFLESFAFTKRTTTEATNEDGSAVYDSAVYKESGIASPLFITKFGVVFFEEGGDTPIYGTKTVGNKANQEKLRATLENSYVNVNFTVMRETKVGVPMIQENGNVIDVNKNKSGSKFYQDNAFLTNIRSVKLPNSENSTNFIQPVITFATSPLMKPVTHLPTEEELADEAPLDVDDAEDFAKIMEQIGNAPEFTESGAVLTSEELLGKVTSKVVIPVFQDIPGAIGLQDILISNIAHRVAERLISVATKDEISITKTDLFGEHGQVGSEVLKAFKVIVEQLDKAKAFSKGVPHPYDGLRELSGYQEEVSELVFTKLNSILKSSSMITEEEVSETVNTEKVPDDNDSLKGGSYIEDSLTITTKDRMSMKLKQKLAFIPKKNTTIPGLSAHSALFRGYLQEHEDFDLILNSIESILAETFDGYDAMTGEFNDMLKILENSAAQAPFLSKVIEILEGFPKDNKLKNEFVSNMLKHYVQMRFIKKGNGKYGPFLHVWEDNSNATKQFIKSLWKEDLTTALIVEPKIVNGAHTYVINEEVRADILEALEKVVVPGKLKNKTERLKAAKSVNIEVILETLGFPVHENVIREINREEGFSVGNISLLGQFTTNWGIFNKIYYALLSEPADTDVFQGKLVNEGFINTLASKEARYNSTFKSHTHTSGNKSITSYAEHKYMTKRAARLKGDLELLTNLAEADFSKDSVWLQELLETDTEGSYLLDENGQVTIKKDTEDLFAPEYMGLNPYTTDSKSYDRFDIKELQKLETKEYEIVKLALFLNKGNTKGIDEVRRTKILPATFSNKSTAMIMNVAATEFRLNEDGSLSNVAVDKFYDSVFMPELRRMVSASTPNLAEGTYDKGKELFHFFPELNNRAELFDKETGKVFPQFVDNMPAQVEALVKKDIRAHLSSLITEKVTYWEDMGIVAKDGTLLITDSTYANKVVNPKLDAFKLTNKKKNKLKAKIAAADFVLNYFMGHVNYHQLFAGDPALFYDAAPDVTEADGTVREATAIEHVKSTRDKIGKRLAMEIAPGSMMAKYDNAAYANYNTLFVNDKNSKSTVVEYLKDLGVYNEKYFGNITATDGVEFVTVEHYLTNRYLLGEIDQQQLDAYIAKENKEGLSEQDMDILLSPQKPVTVATKFDSGVEVKFYIKSAEFPLAKNFTKKSPSLDGIRRFMLKSNVDGQRMAFNSTVKTGKVKKSIDLFDSEGNLLNLNEIPQDIIDKAKVKFSRRDLVYQQKVPVKDKQVINAVSQATKLLFQNLGHVEGFMWDGAKYKGDDLKEEFDAQWGTLYLDSLYSLREELGVPADRVKNLDDWDIPLGKLSQILRDEAIARGYSIPDRASLELDPDTGKFAMPLWAGGNHKKIEALLNSIISNRIFKQEMPGKSYVLGPDIEGQQVIQGYDSIKDNTGIVTDASRFNPEEGLLASKLVPKGKNEAGEVVEEHMTKNQVMVSWNTAWGSMSDFRRNGKFDWTLFDKVVLEGVGMRIPNQNHGSSAPVEIVGFLPENMQNQIITPVDFVAQMGSDFDIDKLYVYWSNARVINDRVVRDLGNDSTTKGRKIQAQNNILDIHQAVLNHPSNEVQAEIKGALDFGGLEEAAEHYAKNLAPKGVYSPFSEQYNTTKYANATSGNDAISVFAVNNTLNARLQAAGRKKINGKSEKVVYNFFAKEPLIFGKQTSEGELSDMSTILGEGVHKSRFLNALLSAAVDDEAEQLLWRLNITPKTRSVVAALAMLGFNQESVLAFVNQPSLLPKNKGRDFIAELNDLIENNEEYSDLRDEEAFQEELQQYLKQGTAELTANHELKDGSKEFLFSQVAVTIKFNRIANLGKHLTALSQTLNLDTARMGKDSFEAIENELSFLYYTTHSSKQFSGAGNLFGEFKDKSAGRAENLIVDGKTGEMVGDTIAPEGFVTLPNGEGYFKPFTREGHVYAYGLNAGTRIWSKEDILPYNNPVVKATIDKAMSLSNLNAYDSTRRIVEFKRTVFNNMKAYIFSDMEKLGLSNLDAHSFREKLLRNIYTGTEGAQEQIQKAFSEYIMEMKNDPLFRENAFLRNLTTRKDKEDPESPIPFVFTGANDVTQDLSSSYIAAETLMLNSQKLSKPFMVKGKDGKMIPLVSTGTELYQLLMASEYALGGIQSSDEFLKLVSIDYLKATGAVKVLTDNVFQQFSTRTAGETLGVAGKAKTDHFVHPYLIQLFQHFSDYAPFKKVPKKTIIDGSIKTHKGKIIRFSTIQEVEQDGTKIPRKTLVRIDVESLRGGFAYGPKGKSTAELFKWNGTEYIRLEQVKERGVRQFNQKWPVALTLNRKKSLHVKSKGFSDVNDPGLTNPLSATVVGTDKVTETSIELQAKKFNLDSGNTSSILEGIKNTSQEAEEQALAAAYQELFNEFSEDTPVVLEKLPKGQRAIYRWSKDNFSREYVKGEKIRIDLSQFGSSKTLGEVYLHEHTHLLFNKIYNNVSEKGGTDRQLRAIREINTAFEEYKKQIDYTKKVKNLSKKQIAQDVHLYAGYNVYEFISMVMTNNEVRESMKGMTTETKYENLLDWIFSKFKALLEAFGLEKNTIAYDAVTSTLTLFEANRVEHLESLKEEDSTTVLPIESEEETIVEDEDGSIDMDNLTIPEIDNDARPDDFSEAPAPELMPDSEGEVSLETVLRSKSLIQNPVTGQIMTDKQNAIKNYKQRIARLESKINDSKDIDKRRRFREIRTGLEKEVDVLFREILELDSSSNYYLIQEMMDREIAWVEEALNSSLDLFKEDALADMEAAEDVLHSWNKFLDTLLESTEDRQLIREVFGQNRLHIQDLLNRIQVKNSDLVVEMTKEAYDLEDNDQIIKALFDPIEDTSYAAGLLRDASRSKHILIQHMQGRIAEANRKTHSELQSLFNGEFADIEENARKTLERLGMGWDVFFAKDQEGRMKDKVITPLSDKYINSEWAKNPYKSKGGKEVSYNKWYLNNHHMIDPVRAMEDRAAYEAELNGLVNSPHQVTLAIDESIKRYEKYLLFRDEQEIILAEKFEDPKHRANILKNWSKVHNPVEVGKNKDALVEFPSKKRPKKLKFSYGLPVAQRGGKDTGYYDATFKDLEQHPELMAFQKEFVNTMHDLNVILPGQVNRNFTIPLFQKALAGAWQGSDVKATGRAYTDKLISTLRGNSITDDLLIESTNDGKRRLSTNFFSKTQSKISTYLEIEMQKWELQNPGKVAGKMTKRALRNIAVDRVVKESSQDVGKNLKMFAALVISYKHKADIETEIAITEKVFRNRVTEAKQDNSGKTVYEDEDGNRSTNPNSGTPVPAGPEVRTPLANELRRLEATLANYYGEKKGDGGSTGQRSAFGTLKFTQAEEALIEDYKEVQTEIDAAREVVNNKLTAKELTKKQATQELAKLEAQEEELGTKIANVGGSIKMGGVIDALMQWVQLKALGWNITSSFANLGFGVLTNNIEAAGEQFYSQKGMNKGYKLIRHSFAKTFGGGGDVGVKIRTLMDENNVLKKPSEEFFEQRGDRKGMKKYYNPFVFTDMTEYLNQGPVMIAVMDTLKLTTKSGEEISIWEAYDARGEWKDSVGNKADYTETLGKAANQIDKAIRNNHGNYDTFSAPIAIKRNAWAKMLTQFRTWMFEGFFNRFETEHQDYEMEITRKGRWRTYGEQGFTKSMAHLTDLIQKKDLSDKLSAVDIANMKKNLRELRNYAILSTGYLLLSLLSRGLKGDDDKKDGSMMSLLTLLINLTSRVQTDILLYINPSAFQQLITKDLFPVLGLYTDMSRVIAAISKMIQGEDELKTGPYKGRSRFLRDMSKATPGAASVYKVINNTTQLLTKEKPILEDFFFDDETEAEKRRKR